QPIRRFTAYVATVAFRPLRGFAKMHADLPMPAVLRLRKADDIAIALPGTVLLCRILNLVDEVRKQGGVLPSPKQHAVSRLAIASGASSFLVVLLDRLRQGK